MTHLLIPSQSELIELIHAEVKRQLDERKVGMPTGPISKLPLSTPLRNLPLTVRAQNCLEVLGVKTLGDIPRVNAKDLLKVRNMGKKTIQEIRLVLAANNLSLRYE